MNKFIFAIFSLAFSISACQPKNNQSNIDNDMNRISAIPITINRAPFGKLPDGRNVELYTMRNPNGMEVRITNYGGIITHLLVPDKKGNRDDVVLGFDSLPPYLGEHPYFGAIIGRYGNRIANGEFSIDGKSYSLVTNNGPNHLHGGQNGFNKKLWKAAIKEGRDDMTLSLQYTSPDGEEGYPGKLQAQVEYTLNNKNELRISYSATTNAPTPINLTNHSYFNLTGDANNTILDHEMQIYANSFIPVNEFLIPTGEIAPLNDSPLDFRAAKKIGRDIGVEKSQMVYGKGFDHCFVFNKNNESPEVQLVATVYEPNSGRAMEVWTTAPGMQFYSGNFLDGSLIGKNGVAYKHRSGFCLETQHFPDSPNQPNFPTTLLQPGETYQTTTIYRFYTK